MGTMLSVAELVHLGELAFEGIEKYGPNEMDIDTLERVGDCLEDYPAYVKRIHERGEC